MEDLIQVKTEAQQKALLQDPDNAVLLFTVFHVQITALSLDLQNEIAKGGEQ